MNFSKVVAQRSQSYHICVPKNVFAMIVHINIPLEEDGLIQEECRLNHDKKSAIVREITKIRASMCPSNRQLLFGIEIATSLSDSVIIKIIVFIVQVILQSILD